MTETTDRPVEKAAQQTTVTGWVCVHCGHFWGVNEHAARRCCATSQPCETCDNRHKVGKRHCDNCNSVRRLQAWHGKPAVEWDGNFPVGDWQTGRYFWFADELLDLRGDIEDYQFTSCAPMQPPTFDLFDHISECIPEGAPMPPGGYELESAVNDWLKKLPPVWQMTGRKLCVESIWRQFVEKKMTTKTIELTDEINQSEPLGYFVFAAHSSDDDFAVFACRAEAEHYAADQQEAAEDDGWPIYPLYASHALDCYTQ